MIKFVDNCCDCAVGGYPCLGSKCPLRNQKIYICDECREEQPKIYDYEGQELCIDCIEKKLNRVR